MISLEGLKNKEMSYFYVLFENEEIQNVKKTIGEGNIFESTTVVVVKNQFVDSRRSAARGNKQEKCDPHDRRERRTQAGGNNNNYL